MSVAPHPSEIAANPLIRRLRGLTALSVADEACLAALTRDPDDVAADLDIESHGQRCRAVHVVMDGLACRYKVLPDGRRQIMAFLVPGDPCDLLGFLLERMDHGVCTLAPSRIAAIPPAEIERIIAERPALARAFWISTMVDAAILREWLVSTGRRDAHERVAHLLWELYLRHRAVGRAEGDSFDLPLTQQELADALGLSAVHVNRTLQRLRADGLIGMDGRTLTVFRAGDLQRIAAFDADYLHFGAGDGADGARERLRGA